MRKIITFLSDFGLEDEWVGVCKGVILNIVPDAVIVDITHQIPSFNLKKAAVELLSALPFMPIGIHLAVVDPGVGTKRRPIVIETGRGDFLVGPDNGIFLPAVDKIGGINKVFWITNEEFMNVPVSQTFNGRDIFAPAAGHLARGISPDKFGPEIEKTTIETSPILPVVSSLETLKCEIIDIDKFGTIRLNCGFDDINKIALEYGRKIKLKLNGNELLIDFVKTFGDVGIGEPAALIDSSGFVCLALNQGNFSLKFNLKTGDRVDIIKN
ncbi:MAG: SAM-dependent chlorinase/fluorinase [Actinobacteria bacterium]|nr:SAM-dependent chlorinase/fluorinase [Actinomycetota bacterium]